MLHGFCDTLPGDINTHKNCSAVIFGAPATSNTSNHIVQWFCVSARTIQTLGWKVCFLRKSFRNRPGWPNFLKKNQTKTQQKTQKMRGKQPVLRKIVFLVTRASSTSAHGRGCSKRVFKISPNPNPVWDFRIYLHRYSKIQLDSAHCWLCPSMA